jgi:uncharacterized protein
MRDARADIAVGFRSAYPDCACWTRIAMQGLSRTQKQLSKALLDLSEGAMLLEVLDGFIAGLLVCPEMIPPSAWLPLVWNERDDDPVFENAAHANKVLGLVMEHYNRVARALNEAPGDYAPIFAVDQRNDDVLWELWIEGFDTAVKLRPEAWLPLRASETRAAEAWRGLMNLAGIARRESSLSKVQIETLSASAPNKIAGWVLDLNDWRLAQFEAAPSVRTGANPFATSSGKVGRNEPCPCGSGKKYKRCCGLN